MQSFKQFSESLSFHLENKIPLSENVFRYGSKSYFDLINEMRENMDSLVLSDVDKEILRSDIGTFGIYLEELEEETIGNAGLTIFDIDDTLFHTTALIGVVKGGKLIKKLTNQEFNNYKLGDDESFDFSEFRDASKFEKESKPISPMIGKLKAILTNAKKVGSDVIMLTARADFDDKTKIAKKFADYGIDIKKDVRLYRAGNEPGGKSPAENKATYVRRFLNSGKYARVRLFDDSKSNLTKFLSVAKEYPDIEFEANFVTPEGTIRKIKESLVPLDLPFITEAEYNGQEVELDKPKRGGAKKFYVYVKNDKGNVIKVQFGDTSGLNAKISNPEARKSFVARHQCELKKDKTKPGYWACRLPWFAKSLGLSGGGRFFW